MQWLQNYSAVGGSLALTAVVVAVPIFYLFWALAVKRMKGHVAGLSTLAVTLVVTILAYGMPASAALSAAALGMATGLFPIGWIILTAVFLYNLTIEAGQFDVIKSSISSLSTDRRIQALLIAFCFSAFMEGVSGQGAPVAVAAAMLIGLGFSPIPAAVICLVANTPPVPFGPVGVPTSMMISVTGLNGGLVTKAIGNNMALMAIIVPIFTLVVLAGWKAAMEVLPAALVVGVSYAVTCLLVAHNLGQELPAILSSFVSMVALVTFLRFWKPASVWRFPDDRDAAKETEVKYTTAQILRAWAPFIIVMIVMGLWGIPALKAWAINAKKLFLLVPSWPFLDGVVYRSAPIVAAPAKYAASYRFEYLTAPGTAMMISALLSMAVLRIAPATGVKVFKKTFRQLAYALVTLASVIGIGFLANYSGMSYTLGLAFATYTGKLFPIFSPVIGWLGVFLTGSVTSSAALFGKLQQVTAMHIGMNPILTTSANLFGGVMGKLISPQSIAVACAAVGLIGHETDIFRKTMKYSLVLLAITIFVVVVQAFVFPGSVPGDVIAVAAG